MKSEKPGQKTPSELRKRAEEKLKPQMTPPRAMSDKEARQLIHELQVHQIELEMQNEELRKGQAELEESRAKYSDLYDFAPVGYITFDKNGLILEVNLTAAKELGVKRSLLIDKPFRTYIVKEDRDIFDSHMPNVFKSDARQTCEIRLNRKDSREFYAQLESIAANDLKGNFLCRSSLSDITERKRAEAVLKTRYDLLEYAGTHSLEELLQKTLDDIGELTNSPIGFYHFVEPDQKTLSLQAWSTRTEKEFCAAKGTGMHYGIDKAGVWVDCVHERRPVIHNNYLSLPHRKGLPQGHAAVIRELVVPIMREDNIVAILGIGNKPTDYTEKDVEIVSFIADVAWEITKRKRAEKELHKLTGELKRSNEDLEQFAYAASHDLQEPLRGIASFTKLLEKRYRSKLDEKADEFIDYIIDGTKRMQTLIKDLLEYSRISTNIAFEPANCSAALEQSIYNLRSAIEESGAEVTYDLLPTVMGDEAQLNRLFQNLIGNALKFRGQEPIKIHISARQKDDEWLFSIKDTGIGIELKEARHIFAIFQRLHTREEFAGTGIGLAICKKIVERHGGRIWVEAEPGKGSTFFFTVPDRQEPLL